jgi:CIC family chloride channel protein
MRLPRFRLQRLFNSLARVFHHQRSSETLSLILSAILVGGLAGLAAVGFDWLVVNMGMFVAALQDQVGSLLGALMVVAIPALGGLLITPIVVAWAPDARGSGIPGVMLAVSNLAGRVPKRLAFWRPLASAISIGSGASLGTEGPVVQLGASLASLTADLLKLNDERRRNLVAVAAAGGIAATFNVPIAGVLFSLEVILGQFQVRYFASVVIGAVSATAVSRTVLGADPAFAVPDYGLSAPQELPLYLLLGVFCGLIGVIFLRALISGEDLFDRAGLSPWLRPAVGGVLVGLLALITPHVLGRGYETTGQILQGELTSGGFLLLLIIAKMLATSASFGSWAAGGIFAPILLIGAAAGALFITVAQFFFPQLTSHTGAFALVGMAAVFSSATRAPMSSIVMIFELSGSYNLILPLLFSAVIATLISELLAAESIYQMILSRKGLSLLRLRETDLLQTVTVREVMNHEIPTLSESNTVNDLTEAMITSHHHGFVVSSAQDSETMIGIVTLSDLETARQAGLEASTPLTRICTRHLHLAFPDEPASDVLERMARYSIGRMPVVHSGRPNRPVGFVRQADLARAYYHALQRDRRSEEQEEALRLRDLTGQEIVEVKVSYRSPLAGKRLSEAGLPQESIVVAVRRQGKTLFPHGETTIEVGDTVVANVAPGFGPKFRQLFTEDAPKGD